MHRVTAAGLASASSRSSPRTTARQRTSSRLNVDVRTTWGTSSGSARYPELLADLLLIVERNSAGARRAGARLGDEGVQSVQMQLAKHTSMPNDIQAIVEACVPARFTAGDPIVTMGEDSPTSSALIEGVRCSRRRSSSTRPTRSSARSAPASLRRVAAERRARVGTRPRQVRDRGVPRALPRRVRAHQAACRGLRRPARRREEAPLRAAVACAAALLHPQPRPDRSSRLDARHAPHERASPSTSQSIVRPGDRRGRPAPREGHRRRRQRPRRQEAAQAPSRRRRRTGSPAPACSPRT